MNRKNCINIPVYASSSILLSLLLLVGCDSANNQATTESVTLKISHFLPAISNAQKNVLEPWCEELSQESSQRIRCEFYPSNQLGGTPATLAEMAQNGIADIVWTAPSYSAGQFPRLEALELPFVLPYQAKLSSPIIWQYYQQHAKEDFKDFKVLSVFGDAGMNLHTRSKAIRSLADFTGLKIRASSKTASKTLYALGATPVGMPPAQMTESISKGVIDGALASWEVVPPTKLNEVTKYHSAIAAGKPAIGYTVLAVLMNKNTYQRMPADLKEILDRHSGPALNQRFASTWDATAESAIANTAKDAIIAIEAQEYKKIADATKNVSQNWAKEATKKGLDGKQLLADLHALYQPSFE